MYVTGLANARAAAGNREEAGKLLAELKLIGREKYVSPYMLALVYASLGENDKALEYLHTAAEIRDSWIFWLAVSPQFDSLREDARYAEILRMINYPLAK
jgi:tetratricopeptide (TPR) repeat protein